MPDMPTDTPEAKHARPEDRLARCALSIAAALAATDPGGKAEARRMDGAGAPVFWRQVARLQLSSAEEPVWLAYTRMVALLTPASATTSVHDAKRPLGTVLHEAGVSEQRLARLLALRGPARLEALERIIRGIARKHPPLDLISLARAAFECDRNDIARSYYRALDRSQIEETQNA